MACSITEIRSTGRRFRCLFWSCTVGGSAGRQVEQPVTLRDVAATLADLAGLPAGVVPGTSLARFWRESPPVEPAYAKPCHFRGLAREFGPSPVPGQPGGHAFIGGRGQALHPWGTATGAAVRP